MLRHGRHLAGAGLLLSGLLLASCGGGGSSGDVSTSAPVAQAINDPNVFLLFPNPQVQLPSGLQQTNTLEYAEAYYAAVDPTNQKDTLDKWKAANGFDSGMGTQVSVVFGDIRDLGYGRRMTARQNLDLTAAFVVDNYLVNPAAGYTYTTVNLEAAVVQDRRWHIGTNAIEFSPGPGGGASFAKFFNFNAQTGARALTVDLDGRGQKAMPGPCIACHGGRVDPLTPPDATTGRPLFPRLHHSVSQARGDTQSQLNAIEVDAIDFLSTPPYTRANQEAALKTLNQMVLCTFPIPPAAPVFPEDMCRRVASLNEWQGAAAALIKNAYGGDGLPNTTFSDTYVPAGWLTVGQSSLYQNVVAQTCRACHVRRGTNRQSDIDFDSYAKFLGYADRIKYHVVDRGNMPLARLPYDRFYNTGAADALATFLQGQGFTARDSAGAVLRPGRPIANPGPDRTITRSTVLSASESLFASTYTWTIVSDPVGTVPPFTATLDGSSSSNSVQPTFNATMDGVYVLQLVVGNGASQSDPQQLTLVVNNGLTPPSSIRFSDIKTVLAGCTSCHNATSLTPIDLRDGIDRNGVGGVEPTDDDWFFAEVRGRINFLDKVASPLLRKPSNNHHNGGLRPGFNTGPGILPGDPLRANYDLFLNWILNGAPQ